MKGIILLSLLDRLFSSASNIREATLSGGVLENAGKGALALALFFFVYVLFEVSMKLLQGQQFPWMDILKPFMIVLVIVNWGPLINTVDTVGEFLNDNIDIVFNSVGKGDDGSFEKNVIASMDAMDAMDRELSEPESVEEGSSDAPVSASTDDPNKFNADKLANKIKRGFLTVFVGSANMLNIGTGLFLLLKKIIGDVLAVLSQLYLLVLALIGPFAFAFGIIPSMNRISQWIGTYLQYWLWVPLINIVQAIMATFNTQVALARGLENPGSGALKGAIDTMVNVAQDMSGPLDAAAYLEFTNVSSIACIFLLLAIPKLARVVIHAGEDVLSANLGRFASQAVTGAARLGTNVATGGLLGR